MTFFARTSLTSIKRQLVLISFSRKYHLENHEQQLINSSRNIFLPSASSLATWFVDTCFRFAVEAMSCPSWPPKSYGVTIASRYTFVRIMELRWITMACLLALIVGSNETTAIAVIDATTLPTWTTLRVESVEKLFVAAAHQ